MKRVWQSTSGSGSHSSKKSMVLPLSIQRASTWNRLNQLSRLWMPVNSATLYTPTTLYSLHLSVLRVQLPTLSTSTTSVLHPASARTPWILLNGVIRSVLSHLSVLLTLSGTIRHWLRSLVFPTRILCGRRASGAGHLSAITWSPFPRRTTAVRILLLSFSGLPTLLISGRQQTALLVSTLMQMLTNLRLSTTGSSPRLLKRGSL